MIFSPAQLVSLISRDMTLEPGDLIACGTSLGVLPMKAGSVVEVLVDNPSSVEALPPMCDELNATHIETIKDPACWRVYIKKD